MNNSNSNSVSTGGGLSKLCGFCHCGENSSLGQGELSLYDPSIDSNTVKTFLKEQLRNLPKINLNADECLTRLQKSFEK
jgi:hypothetical protein